MAGKCQIKRQYSRDRSTLRGSSHCMPGSAVQSYPSDGHYKARDRGFVRSIMSYDICTYAQHKSQKSPLLASARPPSYPRSCFGQCGTQPLREKRRDPPRRGDRPVPPMSVSTINCQLMHPVNSTVVIHIVLLASFLCSLYLVPVGRVQICSPQGAKQFGGVSEGQSIDCSQSPVSTQGSQSSSLCSQQVPAGLVSRR